MLYIEIYALKNLLLDRGVTRTTPLKSLLEAPQPRNLKKNLSSALNLS